MRQPPSPSRTSRWGPWSQKPSLSAEPDNRGLKVLLLHGFASSPAELRPLGQFLSCRGYEVHAPLLPGHGETTRAMGECRLQDWTEAVVRSYWALRREQAPVAVVGFCLGAALGLATAEQLNPRFLVCCGGPVRALEDGLFPPLEDDPEILSTENWFAHAHSPKAANWRRRAGHPQIHKNFLELYGQAIEGAGRALPSVRCPLLVAHSKDDKVCPSAQAQRIVEQVSSQKRKLILSKHAGHGLLVDTGRRTLFAEILKFLTPQESGAFYQS